MKSKIFTHAEAERTFPLLRRITRDISSKWGQIITERSRLEEAEKAVQPDSELVTKIKEDLNYQIDKINFHIKEVEDLGCFVEEFMRGIINFPAYYLGDNNGSRKVFLCWQQDESKVEYWHELNEGFSNRRRIKVYSSFLPYIPPAPSRSKNY